LNKAAILDDREDVWANAKNNVTGRPGEPPDNLLLVKPYHWDQFSDYSDINNASGQDLSVSNDIESQAGKPNMQENDTQLLWTANILRRLHDRYYSAALSSEEREKTSVPSLLHTMRKETFLRFPQVKIVFSGLIPVNKQFKQTQRPNVVRYAEELGAEVLPGISSQVTHVVAARDRSEKVCLARKQVPGCFIVHTSWLMECYWSISWRDEEPHHMGLVPNHLSNRHTTTYQGQEESDDNESEDSFAKNLEKEIMLDTK
jgi:RNA polymerase II subunit A-like phosphatase